MIGTGNGKSLCTGVPGAYGKAAAASGIGEKDFLCLYLFFMSGVVVTSQSFRNLGMCTLITFTVSLQLLAYAMLALKVLQTRSVRGISGKALQLHAVVYVARLSSTTWLKGYIPTDATGNWLYQSLDLSCLLMVVWLQYLVFKRYKYTYQAEEDCMEISYILGVCLVLATLLHPHLNSRPIFDTLWTFSLYVQVFAMMPQIWMVAKLKEGASMDAMTAHFVFAMAVSCAIDCFFWSYGFREFTPKRGGFNAAGWGIMIAHIVRALLLLDFCFLYLKACIIGSIKAVQTGDLEQPQVTVPDLPSMI